MKGEADNEAETEFTYSSDGKLHPFTKLTMTHQLKGGQLSRFDLAHIFIDLESEAAWRETVISELMLINREKHISNGKITMRQKQVSHFREASFV